MSEKSLGFVHTLSCSALLMAATFGVPASATPASRNACRRAFEQAQEQHRQGKLVRARKLLLSCFQRSCGEALEDQCTALMDKVTGELPSVVLSLSDSHGAAIGSAHVRIDDELISSTLDGRALNLDPGTHRVFIKTEDGGHVEQELTILQGQQNQKLSLKLEPTPKPTPKPTPTPTLAPAPTLAPGPDPAKSAQREPSAKRRVTTRRELDDTPAVMSAPAAKSSTLPYLFAGLGVAGVGSFFLLANAGSSEERQLQACWPHCGSTRVEHVRALYLTANVSLGVGVAALATSLVLALSGRPARDESQQATSRPAARYALDVRPSLHGVSAGVSGSF